MDGRCRGFKRDGTRCTLPVKTPNTLCWAHDPKNAGERQRTASKAGRSRASKVSKDLHALLESLTQQVIDGELETSRGAVANQLITTRIKLFEFERRVRETEELAERLAALEQAREKGGQRWGS